MENYDGYRTNQRKKSSNNNRYNFNMTNQANISNNELLYTSTESNWNMKRKRQISGISYQKNNQERFGFPQVYPNGFAHNTANLYLNKKNFSFKKKATNKNNNYYDKEKLYQNMMKLQTSLNILNQKYLKQKMENDKQAKEIERQNKFLNYINEKNLKNMNKNSLYFNTDANIKEYGHEDENVIKKEREDLIKNLTKTSDIEYESNKYVKLNEEKYNLNLLNNNKKLGYNALKDLYNELFKECKERDKLLVKSEKEKEKLLENNDMLKVANETLISNLKRQMKLLEADNEKKDLEIKKFKKNMKCSRYTELLKENEVLNNEMNKLKNKLNDALKLINEYKKQEEEIKKLYEVIKKKDFKIKALELELITLSNNSDETTKKLQDEIIIKDKLLKKQEREMKKIEFEKFASMQGHQNNEEINNINVSEKKYNKSSEKNVKDISSKYPELYQFYIEMKHKGIDSSKNFNNEVIKKISDVKTINDAKIEYIDLILNYFKIDNSDEKARDVILNLADKEFSNNKSINEIKNRNINILDMLFNKTAINQNMDKIKKYIEQNSLEELINNTILDLDKNKLGYITFAEMKKAINEVGLNEFKEEILLLTKSEIFNRCDYYNLLFLFKEDNKIDINNYAQINKEENNILNSNENIDNNDSVGIHDIKDESGEKDNIINNNDKDINKENKEENKDGNINENVKENKNNEDIKLENNNEENNLENNNEQNNGQNNEASNEENNKNNNEEKEEKKEIENNRAAEELEKKLKIFVHNIKKEGASPINYISHLKEKINIDNDEVEAINNNKLKEFLSSKNIDLKEDELNILYNTYKINDEYINFDLFGKKLLNIIQNDSDNDEDFFENIPVMEIGGID